MLELIQDHTRKIYDLDNKEYQRKKIPARDLLVLSRFDLFAKLIYIHYRESDKDFALKIYGEHIKAFNPDLKEPGRTDKNNLQDFIQAFDELIDFFKDNSFDPAISLIPVSENGVPLDGSHRVAALAYYNKEVEILQFKNVFPKADFDFKYFLNRGLARDTADSIVKDSIHFIDNLFIACLWPRMGDSVEKELAINQFTKQFSVFYTKSMQMSLEKLSMFIYEIYDHQDWVGNKENNYAGARNKAMQCYGKSKTVDFIVFQAESLKDVVALKEAIRDIYNLDKHALHITDNKEESEEVLDLVFTENKEKFTTASLRRKEQWEEYKLLFKNVYLINAKVKVAAFLKKIGLRK